MQQGHFHCQFDIIKRSQGHSVVKKAAYNSRSQLYSERDQKNIDYTVKQDLLYERIIAPKGAKDWVFDREQHYNKVEATDNRSNSQLGRTIEIGLQHQLTLEQNKELLERYLQQHFVSQGMVADYCIHAPEKDGDQRNIHAHVILSMRKLDGDNFSQKKAREWNDKKLVQQWREAWEKEVNQTFQGLELAYYIDHRSLKDQGKAQLPQRHEGKQATHLKRRKGVLVAKAEYNNLIDDMNQIVEQTAILNREAQLLSKREKKQKYAELLQAVLDIAYRAVELQQEELDYWIHRKELDGVMAEREQSIITRNYIDLQYETVIIGEVINKQIQLLDDTEEEETTENTENNLLRPAQNAPEQQLTDFEKLRQEVNRKVEKREADNPMDQDLIQQQQQEQQKPPDKALEHTEQPLSIANDNRKVADNIEIEALQKAFETENRYRNINNRTPKSVEDEYRLKLAQLTGKIKPETMARHFREATPSALHYERLIRDYLRRKGFSNIQINRAIRRASPAVYKKSEEEARRYARKLNNFIRKQQRKDEQEQQRKQQQSERQTKRKKQQRGRQW